MKRKRPHPRSVAGMNAARTEELVNLMDEEKADHVQTVIRNSPYGVQKQREADLARKVFGVQKIRENIAKYMTEGQSGKRVKSLDTAHRTTGKLRVSPHDFGEEIATFYDQAMYHAIFPPSKLNAITYGRINISELPLTQNTFAALDYSQTYSENMYDPTTKVKNLIKALDQIDQESKVKKENLIKVADMPKLKIDQPQMSSREWLELQKELDYQNHTINGNNPYPTFT